MRKLILTGLATCSFMTAAMAQTLFTFGSNPVSKDEFLRVYQKNSMNKKPDFSEPALREYLDLYSLFRMKVKEAEIQMLDTTPSIQTELNNYRKQLAKNYLTDEEVTNRLMHEAYDRMKEEVHVAHILILSSQMAPSADTVESYRRIDSIYNALTKKNADFGELAKKFSDDKGSKATGGDIGFITALQTVYPFENAVYSTPVGKISKPFHTQFGYHIVKVIEKRPARGELKVAQILISTPESRGEEGIAAARKRIDSIEADLKMNVPFDQLVKKYSDDKFSINDGGVMPTFGVGKWAPEFENAAYALKNPGDISGPVKTNYGFHIIKLIQKYPLKPFDSLQATIKKKVDNDSRSSVAHEIYMNKVKQKNGFKEYPANLDAIGEAFSHIPDTGKNANSFKASDYKNMNQPLFTLAGKTYNQSDLIGFAETLTRGRIMGPKKAVVKDIYSMYVNNIVNDLQEHMLVEEKPEFRNLMEEYRDGIMLFELMDRNVWGKASKDTTGLKAFYETRKNKYLWEPGFTGAVYHFKNETAKNEGIKLLNKKGGMKDEDLVKKLNKDTIPDAVTIQHGRYEFSKFNDFPQAALVKGKMTEVKKNADGSYTVVKVEEVYSQPTPKSLDEARGYAIAEYQDYLEKQWNEEMRRKYGMKLDEGVFKSIVKNN
jgi:peptidyl-prolyl cis-trans isomerase SurA